MKTLLIVEGEVPCQPPLQFRHRLITSDVNVFVFHRPPQPLDEHVVQRPTPTVHAHRYTRRQEPPRNRFTLMPPSQTPVTPRFRRCYNQGYCLPRVPTISTNKTRSANHDIQ